MDNIVTTFARQLLKHRKYNYSQEPLEDFVMVNHDIASSSFRIPNSEGHLLETILIHNRHKSNTCILYAHGLGSNKLETLSIAKYFLKHRYDICSFDFSGSGRSEGQVTTYGLNEKNDLLAVLRHLELTEQYERIVLWGRSMGAVAVVLSQEEPSPKVVSLVLDSPFASFQRIAVELASKKSLIPQFMLQLLIQPLKTHFSQGKGPNPFSIDLQRVLSKLSTPILLIYSPHDTIVSSQHSKTIATLCKTNPREIIIQEDHNMQRSKETLQKSLEFIEDANREADKKILQGKSRNRGISVASKDNKERESVRSRSKLKLVQGNSSFKLTSRQSSSAKMGDRHMYTVGSLGSGLNDSMGDSLNSSLQYRPRRQTQASAGGAGLKSKLGLNSLLVESKIPQHRLLRGSNKQNMRPALNLMRKNRFR